MTDHIIAGFLPLLDSAILVAAKTFGFAEAENINLTLTRETSWAAIRDRMAVGHFDAAQMLAPMPIAANLGLAQMPVELVAPMALGLGGNAVSVSTDLADRLRSFGLPEDGDAVRAGAALRTFLSENKSTTKRPLRFGVVHPFSGHNMELRYWLSASGIDPENDVNIVILPPPLLPDALASGKLDGFCVGEPWSSVAVQKKVGEIITLKSAIWRSSPEKVLAVHATFAKDQCELTERLVRALYRAAQWCAQRANHEALAQMLSDPTYLGQDEAIIHRGLSGNLLFNQENEQKIEDFFLPFDRAATFPWQSHALWFYSQMVRWQMMPHTAENAEVARRSYGPEIYRSALQPMGANIPSANAKVEGALSEPTLVATMQEPLILGPDGFFDGRVFDPDKLDDYIAHQVMN